MKPVAFLLLPALFACTDDKMDDTGGGPDGSGISDVVVTVSDLVATVVTVTWTTETATAGKVSWDGGETPVEASASTTHSAVVRGLAPDTTYALTIHADDGMSEPVEVTTGLADGALPSLTPSGSGDFGSFLAFPVLGASTAAVVLDAQGNYVWWWEDERGLDTYRVRVLNDGSGVVYNAANISGEPSPDSALVKVSWDGLTVEAIDIPYLAHDFVQLADGSFTVLTVKYEDYEGVPVRGDALVHVDLDGTQTEIWDSWDCFDPATDGDPFATDGWPFGNALDVDEAAGRYYLGMRTFSSIASVDPSTRTCDWVVGDAGATIEADESFLHQHQFEFTDTGTLLVFDNDGSGGTRSRVVEYDFDPEAGTADLVWEHHSDPEVYSFVLGEPHRIEGGDTVIAWATAGQLDRVGPDSSLKFRVNTEMGYVVGFTALADSLYP